MERSAVREVDGLRTSIRELCVTGIADRIKSLPMSFRRRCSVVFLGQPCETFVTLIFLNYSVN